MSSSGCSLSLSNERKRFQEEIALVPRVDEDPFGGTSGVPGGLHATYASIYIQKNANRVSCAACLELVQV